VLSEANVLQKNSGSFDATSGTATLPAGTTAGSTVLIISRVATNNVQLNVPDGFDADITPIGLGGAILQVWRRRGVPAGESSWALVIPALASLVIWLAYEITGLDQIEPLDLQVTSSGTGVTSITSGTVTTSVDDVMCLAIHTASNATTVSGWTGGFDVDNEQLSQTSASHGNGTVAAARLWPGVAGTYESTATFGVSTTALAAMLTYRAIGVLETPLPAVTSPGGPAPGSAV
jgi:hypothetical protein